MTTSHKSPIRAALEDVFPEFPPREDMLNPLYLHSPAHQAALARYFGSPETTLVLCEVPVNWQPSGNRREVLIPDLTVAFDINPDEIIGQRGYSIADIGKPPDFALEVASPTTGVRDYTYKRNRYAEFGIREYWRFDHTGGEYHDVALAGDRLGIGGYDPIEIVAAGGGLLRGHSEVLGLDICWEHGHLRFYDPLEGRYLLTFDEEADGRLAAEEQASRESEARRAAEDGRLAADAARLAAEAEVRRLRDKLSRLQSENE